MFKAVFEQMNNKKKTVISFYNSQGAELDFTTNLMSNMDVSNHFSILQDIYQLDILHYKSLYRTYYDLFKLANNKIKNKFCVINQKFVYYMISLKSNTLSFKNKLLPGSFWKFSIRSYTPFTRNFQQPYEKKITSYLVSIKYIKIVKLSTKILNFLVNTAILTVTMKTFLGNIKETPASILNILKDWQLVLDASPNSNIVVSQYLDLDLEHHIYKKYNFCIFLFFNYKQYFNYSNFYCTSCKIYKTMRGIYLFGTGLQINLPAKQMPNIKVKYEINNDGICRLYTKLYFK